MDIPNPLHLEIGLFIRPFDWQLDAGKSWQNWWMIIGPVEIFISFIER